MYYQLLIFNIFFFYSLSIQNFCENYQNQINIDISKSKIIKTKIYEYKIQIYDNQVNFIKNQKGEINLKGNFSKIILINNALKKQYIYNGNQMIFKIPSNHYYSKNKSADAQIQLIYTLQGEHKENLYKILVMSQLYLITKFLSKIQTTISQQINRNLKNGTILKTSKLMKIISKTPMLMYEGEKQFYPCRQDLLCMVRKEFVLVSQKDIQFLKKQMKIQTKKDPKYKHNPFIQQKLYQVGQIIKKQNQIVQQL